MNTEVFSSVPETQEIPIIDSGTTRRQRISDRMGIFLEDYAFHKAYGEAHRENNARDKASQDEAYATYEDNTELSQEANRIERPEVNRIRDSLSKIGNFALVHLEAQGIIPLRGRWHKQGGVSGFIAKKYVAAMQRKNERLEAGFLPSQEEVSETPDQVSEEDRAKIARERVLVQARQALDRKTERKVHSPVRERTSVLWQSVQSGKRTVGSSVLDFFAKSRNNVVASHEAWKDMGT